MHGFGRDVGGRCLGDVGSRCQRIVQMGTTTILFHFLRLTSGSHEADASDLGMMLSGRDQPDVVFLGCPFYETIFPNAYNYSRSRAQRQRANEAGTQRERWSAVQRTIGACAAFAARARAAKPRSRLFLLGPTPLAEGAKRLGVHELALFEQINGAFGISCGLGRGSGFGNKAEK